MATSNVYRAAKERLFTALLVPHGRAILNADSPEFARLANLCRERGHRVIAYGCADGAELRIIDRLPRPLGQRLMAELFGERHTIDLPLVGDFQAMNVLAALGLVVATGVALDAALPVLPKLSGVPGRLQLVGESAAGAPVFVDYAHTPDALASALAALRPHAERRLAIVFGAGGDRDRGKRPLMGARGRRARRPPSTSPTTIRGESPRKFVARSSPQRRAGHEIGDRRAAIAAAIAELRRGDVLVIAGKGHETGQIVGSDILPFDDAAVAREALGPPGRA